MPRSYLAQCILIFCCFSIDLAYAYSDAPNNQRSLSDEIKQSQDSASQSVLNALNAHTPTDSTSQQSQTKPKTSAATPSPRSNSDKAFAPLQSASSTPSSEKNPWLQPNPWANPPPNIWEKNAKVNPYSNAPIPGPAPSVNSIVRSPPNIFAPARPEPNTQQTPPNANF